LLAAEKVKKRRFSRNALKVAFELIILKRYCWYPQCKLVLESGMNSTDRCLGDVYDLKAMGREQQGLQLKRALEALHLFNVDWKESILYVLHKLSNPSGFEAGPVTLSDKLGRDMKKVAEMSLKYKEQSRNILSCPPGKGFNGWYHRSKSEPTTLLHALSRPCVLGKNFFLSLPPSLPGCQLPCVLPVCSERVSPRVDPVDTTTHSLQELHPNHNDDSFDSGVDYSEEDVSLSSSPLSVWSQLDLTVPHVQHTNQGLQRSLPYLTEAGPEAFGKVHEIYMRGLYSLAGVCPPSTTLCRMEDVMKSTLLVLHATPTKHYVLDRKDAVFHALPGLHLLGTSYQACGNLLDYFAGMGTFYYRLEQSLPVLLGMGVIYRGVANALQSFLQLLVKSILRMSDSHKCKSLLALRTALHKELSHLKHLAGLFGVDSSWPLVPSSLPKGVLVLDGLYNAVLHSMGTSHSSLLLAVLRSAMKSFLIYMQQWVFFGVCIDHEEEFGMKENPRALAARDHTYWFEGYSLTDQPFAPVFMSPNVAHQIFMCGKALLLLKQCDPSNYVFNKSLKHPNLKIVFSDQNLMDIEEACSEYQSTVVEHGRRWLAEVRENKEKQKQDQLDALVKERKMLLLGAAQAKKVEEEKMAVEEARKKLELRRLKEQMKQDRERRSRVTVEERERDRKMVEEAVRIEREEDENTRRLKEQAKEELLLYYEELMAEAAMKERRAVWRKKRIELNQLRRDFIINDFNNLMREVGEQLHGPPNGEEMSDGPPDGKGVSDGPPNGEGVSGGPGVSTVAVLEGDADNGSVESTLSVFEGTGGPLVTSTGSHTSANTRSMEQDLPTPEDETPPPKTEIQAAGTGTPPPRTGIQPTGTWTPPPKTEIQPTGTGTPPPTTETQTTGTWTPPPEAETQPPDPPPSTTVLQDPPLSSEPMFRSGSSWSVRTSVSLSTRGQPPKTSIERILYPGGGPVTMVTHVSTRGKEPPSQAQYLMYPKPEVEREGHAHGTGAAATLEGKSDMDWHLMDSVWFYYKAQPYERDSLYLVSPPSMERLHKPARLVAEDYRSKDVNSEEVSPLSVVLNRCVTTPLRTQSSLINFALVEYFKEVLNITEHFVALRRFLLLEDGEFGHTLSNGLFAELSSLNPVVRLTSFAFLNPLLTSSLQSSIYCDSIQANRLSFGLKYTPQTINSTSSDALDFLELHYSVDWPCNIVITEDMLTKYNKILHFFLQLKRTSWALKDVFHYLKHCEGRGTLSPEQIRELLAFRYHMQHFVTVVQGYMANQVVHISWEEFQKTLSTEVTVYRIVHTTPVCERFICLSHRSPL
jgi:hypothetical protein